jgi:predicted DNA-binding antitoxin AbrB/MazE fold protein
MLTFQEFCNITILGGLMSVVVEGIYEEGIVKLKTEVEIPDNTEVLVVFKEKKDKERFLKSAGSWENIDPKIFSNISKSRKDLRDRNTEI